MHFRNEKNHKKGVSHFLEKLSYSRTQNYESPEHMVAALEPYGGMYESLHFRDVAVFIVSCLPDGLETATDILSQVFIEIGLRLKIHLVVRFIDFWIF